MSLKAKMRWRRDFLTKEMTKSTIENNKSPREARPRRPTTKLKKAIAMGAGFGMVKYEKKVGRITVRMPAGFSTQERRTIQESNP